MQNQFQPDENLTPQTASLAASQTPQTASLPVAQTAQTAYLPAAQTSLTTETEAEAQDVQAITERLNAITTRAKNARRLSWWSVTPPLVFTLVGIGLPHILKGDPTPLSVTVSFLPAVGMLASFFWLFRATNRAAPQFDADELARLGGVQAIPALLMALQVPGDKTRGQALYAALTSLLPQMKASDARLLTPAARRDLHISLTSAYFGGGLFQRWDPFHIAILKALEQVGDAKAIPTVERLANMKARTPERKALKQAAIECLPMLQANSGEVETSRTLLRASHAADARPDTLLRPASGSGQTDSAELLRGADSPDAVE